ncbi:hypothetical protein SGLAM104S_10228 [Streptomyces glaucescens]
MPSATPTLRTRLPAKRSRSTSLSAATTTTVRLADIVVIEHVLGPDRGPAAPPSSRCRSARCASFSAAMYAAARCRRARGHGDSLNRLPSAGGGRSGRTGHVDLLTSCCFAPWGDPRPATTRRRPRRRGSHRDMRDVMGWGQQADCDFGRPDVAADGGRAHRGADREEGLRRTALRVRGRCLCALFRAPLCPPPRRPAGPRPNEGSSVMTTSTTDRTSRSPTSPWPSSAARNHPSPSTRSARSTRRRSLKGARVTGSLHMTVQSFAVSSRPWSRSALRSAGPPATSSPPRTTRPPPSPSARTARPTTGKAPVFAWKGETLEYWWCTEQALTWPTATAAPT